MFFREYGSKNGPKCARGFASTLYTPSVRGSAQAREQKVSKMLPWSCFLRGTGAKRLENAPAELEITLTAEGLKWSACSCVACR